MNTQDKFMKMLQKNVPDHLEVVDNTQFANTGTILIQPHDSFECVLEVRYSFQDNYCTFEITPSISINYRKEGPSDMVHIQAPFEKLDRLIKDIINYLIGAR